MKPFMTMATAILSLAFTATALAAHEGHDHMNHDHSGKTLEASGVASASGAACEDTTIIKVNGLVCDFCARALEKVFGQRDEVSGINVDLDNSKVTVATKPGKHIDNATLTQLITDSGYNVSSIKKGCDNAG